MEQKVVLPLGATEHGQGKRRRPGWAQLKGGREQAVRQQGARGMAKETAEKNEKQMDR